ncbi:MAG: hypothetical protein OEQ39_02090 [Gammaproteobacteria bacterium]|nr:hypothetical protein [Gammaproteobacteria bacterium]MDH3467322.1 hypothetical protein [Gammaproteobacteria bacterium]
MPETSKRLQSGRQFLADSGLNILGIFDVANLPAPICDPLRADGVAFERYRSLVLIAAGGVTFWSALQAFGMRSDNPVDAFSRYLAERFVAEYLQCDDALHLYPGRNAIPLQQLGVLAGWHHPSPLGLGIHAKFGLWFAYRSAILVTQSLPPTRAQLSESPCVSCADKPCVSTCPPGAVRADNPLALATCIGFRLKSGSVCEAQCLARGACPVGVEHRYPDEQTAYYARHSLASLRRYRAGLP